MLNAQPFDDDDLQDLLNAALATPSTQSIHPPASPPPPLSLVPPEYHPTVHDIPEDDRPRERLQKQGPDTLSTSDLLAIVLRTGTTHENVMELATRLLIKYGGLAGLVSADFHEISNEYGLGQAKTAQLKAALELGKRLSMLEIEKRYKGTVNSSVLRIAEILRPAIVRNCPRLIVCHNHPSGDPAPSPEDIDVTNQLVEAGKLLDIDLLDHLIIGNPRYLSLKEKLQW